MMLLMSLKSTWPDCIHLATTATIAAMPRRVVFQFSINGGIGIVTSYFFAEAAAAAAALEAAAEACFSAM